MEISTNVLYSSNATQISLESLMEKVDYYLNNTVKKPFELISVSYIPVENKFSAVITIRRRKHYE